MTLEEYLQQKQTREELVSVILSISHTCQKIALIIKTSASGKTGSRNVYGEEQLALDILAHDLLTEELKKNKFVGLIASEEMEGEDRIGTGNMAVCFDPFDGSSLIDANLSVGTIFGIYEAATFMGIQGKEMKASGYVLYGPRTSLMLSIGQGVTEFVLKDHSFVIVKENYTIGEGKMFAPGNLRIVSERDDYLKLTEFWMKNDYTLRYSGGMVPDINQILVKGKGIFTYPGSVSNPDGKLRLLFECAPISYLIEQAGGLATDGKIRILEKVVSKIDQRTPILAGSKEEVKRAEEYLGGI